MNVFQAAKQLDCGEIMHRACQPGRLTAGGRGKWKCPFHDDHDPSLVTYPGEPGNPSHYYCFSCGAHGDAVDLYRRLANTAPLDAARMLCKQWGLTYDEPTPRGASANKKPPGTDSDPRLAIVLAICGEWQRYRIKWYEEQILRSKQRLATGGDAAWAEEMEQMWHDHYVTELARCKAMSEWEVLHDIRAEFEALGVNPIDVCTLREQLLEDWRPSPGYLTPTRAQRIAAYLMDLPSKEIDKIGRYFLSGCPPLREETANE